MHVTWHNDYFDGDLVFLSVPMLLVVIKSWTLIGLKSLSKQLHCKYCRAGRYIKKIEISISWAFYLYYYLFIYCPHSSVFVLYSIYVLLYICDFKIIEGNTNYGYLFTIFNNWNQSTHFFKWKCLVKTVKFQFNVKRILFSHYKYVKSIFFTPLLLHRWLSVWVLLCFHASDWMESCDYM